MDNCYALVLDCTRRDVAMASPGILIMLTLLFWVVMGPLILYLVFVGVLVVIARWFKK